ncbi:MAG: hypothetical protein BGO12_15780 [Verrucomicrobia bacterium 61-8]|nr:PAS domain S-box protein [Verrucomicrobiota bacterium]OJV15694.1 MAG: hypothetical protein BGO12_15780 [Verrucomicrobia bacterium 61-8]
MTPDYGDQQIQAAYLAAIVNSSDDAIIGKNLQSIVTSWNPAAERILGFTAEEMVGDSIKKIIPPDRLGEEEEIIAKICQGEQVSHFETIRRTRDGQLLEVSVTISPIRDGSGRIAGASTILRNISERKLHEREREEQLEREKHLRTEAERANQIKNDFITTLSHELRTPLTAILGWSQILRGSANDAESVTRAVDVIYRNARTLTQLVEDMLDMNRILMGRVKLDLQILDLSSVISAAVESVSPSADLKQITITKAIDPAAAEIRGDPTRLQQVIWNLLTNAIKFTPKDGSVDILLDQYEDYARISVRDTGMGIKPEFLPRVFERFTQEDSSTTRKYGGLGLGLAIVKNLVELHGGVVAAESEGEGRGATFRVMLPLPPALSRIRAARGELHRPTDFPDGMSWEGPTLKGKNVLVVDDDPDASEIVSRILSQYGAEVTTVESGPTALSMLDSSRYHVLISDIAMPEMDGYEFVRAIRESGNRAAETIPAIALTAFSRSEDRRKAMLAGFDIFLSKPVDPPELLAVVSRYAQRERD